MRALVYRGPWQLDVQQRPDPTPQPGQAILRILATGICGSDLHGFTGESGRRVPGQVMGHESVGTVVDAGGRSDLSAGGLVTFNPVVGCTTCAACRAGRAHHCETRIVLGVEPSRSAGLAELMTLPAANLTALPAGLPPDLGALVEPLSVGFHAVRRADPRPEARALVIGAGPIGQAVALAARRAGVQRILISERAEARRRLAAELGFVVIDPTEPGFPEAVHDQLQGPPDLVLDSVGSSASVGDALTLSSHRATVVLVGMESPALDVAAYRISTEERTIMGSFCYSPAEFGETADWLLDQQETLLRLIDHRVGLDDAPATFGRLARGELQASKVLVYPNGLDTAVPAAGR